MIIEIALNCPGIYLHEIQQYICEETGTSVLLSTISKFLHNQGFTHQKMVRVNVNQSYEQRTKVLNNVSIFNKEMIVFVDESGSDHRDCLRKYGYSLRGKPAKALQFYSRGKHISAIAAMSTEGLLECTLIEGGVSTDIFQTYLEEKLSLVLNPYNGSNPRSVVILDNVSIHHTSEAVQLLKDLGVLIYFLPAYSPDLNPIEELYAKLKVTLKSYEHCDRDQETVLLMAFAAISTSDCQAGSSMQAICNV